VAETACGMNLFQSSEGMHVESENQNSEILPSVEDIFFTVEIDAAELFVGDLFRRRFGTDVFPVYPHHYVAFVTLPDNSLRVMGYVHYKLWQGCALCGGLVIDERNYRKLPGSFRRTIKNAGGIAELILRDTFLLLPEDVIAIWGHVGDSQSEKVCRRVGFERTQTDYLMVIWKKSNLTTSEKNDWIERALSLGAF